VKYSRASLTRSGQSIYLTKRLSMQVHTRDELDPVFGALANEHRREIVRLLALQPSSISRLAQLRDLSLPAIHKHVRVLEEAEMVRRRKIGRTNFLSLERKPILDLQSWVDQFQPWWGTGRESLENYAAHLSKDPTTTEET
jgi:DNA-binding transcriptional ArsR family regulator